MPDDPVVPPQPPAPPAPPPPPQPDPQVVALQQKLAETQSQIQVKEAEMNAVNQRAAEKAQKLREQILRSDFRMNAVAAGIIDPKLVDHLPIEGATVDEAGNVTGMEKAIDAIRAKHPVLFKTPATTVAAVPPAPQQGIEPPPPQSWKGKPQADVDAAIMEARAKLRAL